MRIARNENFCLQTDFRSNAVELYGSGQRLFAQSVCRLNTEYLLAHNPVVDEVLPPNYRQVGLCPVAGFLTPPELNSPIDIAAESTGTLGRATSENRTANEIFRSRKRATSTGSSKPPAPRNRPKQYAVIKNNAIRPCVVEKNEIPTRNSAALEHAQ